MRPLLLRRAFHETPDRFCSPCALAGFSGFWKERSDQPAESRSGSAQDESIEYGVASFTSRPCHEKVGRHRGRHSDNECAFLPVRAPPQGVQTRSRLGKRQGRFRAEAESGTIGNLTAQWLGMRCQPEQRASKPQYLHVFSWNPK